MDFKKFLSSSSADPKQILKIVLLFAVVMLVMWLFMISRMDTQNVSDNTGRVTQIRSDSTKAAINESTQVNSGEDDRSPNIFMNAFTTFLVLVSILGLVWLWSRKQTVTGHEKEFKQLGSQMLGQNAHLKILEINNEVWILGVTMNNVNLLYRYSMEEWTESVEKSGSEAKSFYNILNGEK